MPAGGLALALGGGVGQGREGREGHGALCHRAPEAGKGKPRRSGADSYLVNRLLIGRHAGARKRTDHGPDRAVHPGVMAHRPDIMDDKAYDADAIIVHIRSQGAAPNIPIRSNRNHRRYFSKALYKERNRIERFFNKIKPFRRIVTRYEKLAGNYLAMIKLAPIRT